MGNEVFSDSVLLKIKSRIAYLHQVDLVEKMRDRGLDKTFLFTHESMKLARFKEQSK